MSYTFERDTESLHIYTAKGKCVASFASTPMITGTAVVTEFTAPGGIYFTDNRLSKAVLEYLKATFPLVDVYKHYVISSPRIECKSKQRIHWLLTVGKEKFFTSTQFLRWQPPKTIRNIRIGTQTPAGFVRYPSLDAFAYAEILKHTV